MSSNNSETHEKILAAAWKLLEENQGKNVRMTDIANTANLSRQAVYLHFKSRINLMVATVQYGDKVRNASVQVQPWTEAEGIEKLNAWIKFWGNYIPQIFGVAKALMLARESDEAAAAAWDNRMEGVRNCCKQTIESLAKKKQLTSKWNTQTATDILWTLLSISAWEQYTKVCGWSTEEYIKYMQDLTHLTFLKPN